MRSLPRQRDLPERADRGEDPAEKGAGQNPRLARHAKEEASQRRFTEGRSTEGRFTEGYFNEAYFEEVYFGEASIFTLGVVAVVETTR